MQPAYPRQGHYLSRSDGPRFNLTGTRRLFIKSDVRSVFMVIAEVVLAQPHQVSFVQRDHMIKQLAADTAHPSFRDSILPGAPNTCPHSLNPARLQESLHLDSRSEEHTSELQSRGLISYAVFCLKK